MMRRHIGDNRPEEIARRLNIGCTWFRRTFRRLRGHRPGAIPVATAPQQGPELLTTTDRTVSEIAAELGFENVSQFSAFFRQRERSPPRSTAANTDSDRSRRPLFGKRISAPFVEKEAPKDREAKMRGNSPRTSQNDHERLRRAQNAQLRLRRLGKVRERLCARLLNVVLHTAPDARPAVVTASAIFAVRSSQAEGLLKLSIEEVKS